MDMEFCRCGGRLYVIANNEPGFCHHAHASKFAVCLVCGFEYYRVVDKWLGAVYNSTDYVDLYVKKRLPDCFCRNVAMVANSLSEKRLAWQAEQKRKWREEEQQRLLAELSS